MLAGFFVAALALGQASAEVVPPTLRAELPAGRMAVYDIAYSRELARPEPSQPRRLYIPDSELYAPGPWGYGFFGNRDRWDRPWRGVGRGVSGSLELLLSFGYHGAGLSHTGETSEWGGGSGRAGVGELLRPCLTGFHDRFLDGPESLVSFAACSTTSNLRYRLDLPQPEDGVWRVRGRQALNVGGHPEDRPSLVFDFDPARKHFTRARAERAYLSPVLHRGMSGPGDGDAAPGHDCGHPIHPTLDVEFTLRSVDRFPPPDLAARIDTARRRGAAFLAEHAGEVASAPWFASHPVGTRAVVAWALLDSGGDLAAARGLLDAALREPLRGTYDAAFLILALDALLDWTAPVPVAEPAGGDVGDGARGDGTTVVRPAPARPGARFGTRSERAGYLRALQAAAGFLASAREKGTGLWGYNPGGAWCERERDSRKRPCDHTTCWSIGVGPPWSVDISNTYWALDALEIAGRRGFAPPRGVWDQALRSLDNWSSYIRTVYKSRYERILSVPSYPREARERFAALERRDRVLSLARRLRVPGEALELPGASRPEPVESTWEHGEVRYFPYIMFLRQDGVLAPTLEDLGGYFTDATPSATSHLSGVGSAIIALRSLGQDPLASGLVQRGLLLTRLHIRLLLASYDVDWCPDLKREITSLGYLWLPNLQPRDPGYNFLLLERVLDALGVERLGNHEWFPLLALHSLDFQWEDGGWYPWRGDRLVPTALHLLFLGRGQRPSFAGPLPTYRPSPVLTGEGAPESPGPWEALVEGKGGKLHRVAEVVGSLLEVDAPERLRLARKGLESLAPGARAAYRPLLEQIVEEGPEGAKSFAKKALADLDGAR